MLTNVISSSMCPPGGAPVSLAVDVHTNELLWKPYVFDTAIGNQMMFRKKSSKIIPVASLKMVLYVLGFA